MWETCLVGCLLWGRTESDNGEGVALVFRKAVITTEHGLGVAGVFRTGDRE